MTLKCRTGDRTPITRFNALNQIRNFFKKYLFGIIWSICCTFRFFKSLIVVFPVKNTNVLKMQYGCLCIILNCIKLWRRNCFSDLGILKKWARYLRTNQHREFWILDTAHCFGWPGMSFLSLYYAPVSLHFQNQCSSLDMNPFYSLLLITSAVVVNVIINDF